MEDRNVGKEWPGHGTCWSEMELKIDEPQKSSLPVKQWMIGADQQSLKSKVDRFSEIVRSPVQCLRTHDDVSSPNIDFAFQNTTLYSIKDDFNDNTHKRHPSEEKPRDSTSSQTKVLDKHTKTENDSENVIFPQSGVRQDCKGYEQVTLFSESETIEAAVHRLQNCISNTEFQFSSVPVESLTKISLPHFPSVSHGSSLDSNVLSPELHNEVSPSSKCNSHPFSPGCTQVLSAELLWFCSPMEKNVEGLTEMCTVESLLHDREKDFGKGRNMEGVKDLPIQTNAEEEERSLPAYSASAAPLPGLPPITPVDSSCPSYPSSAEGVEESRSREDCEAGFSFTSVMPGEALQTQHKVLHSPGSHYMKGPNPGKTEEGGAGIMSARRSVKPEVKTVEKFRVGLNLRKGAKEKKAKEMTGERVRGPLIVTRPKTRGRIPTAVPELLIKVPYSSLDSTRKVESKTQNKATWMSCKCGAVSETESGREMEKDMKSPEQFVAAPVIGTNITGTLFNKSALDLTNNCDYSCLIRSDDKTKVSRARRSKTMDNVGCGLNSSVNARSNRKGKALSEVELGSSAIVDDCMWSSKHSTTQSAKTTGCIEREEKEGEINNMFGVKELTKRPELGVKSRGHQFYQNRKRIIEIQSVGNSQFSDVQVSQSEMTGESLGNETSGQRNKFQRGMMLQRGNDGFVKDAKEEGSHEDTGNEVAKGDEDGILCSRDFQREWVSEQDTKNVGKTYLKEACKIRPVSIQGKGRCQNNTSSKSNTVSPKTQGLIQSTDNKPSNILLESDVDCKNVIQEFTQISLPMPADTRPLIPDHWSGKSVSMQNNKEANEEGGTTPILSIHSMDTLPKSKKRKSSRKAGTHRRKDRYSRTGKDTPMVVKEQQRKDNLVKISGSSPLRSYLKRRHSYPEINPLPGGPRPTLMLASSPLGRLPCSDLPRHSSVKRARRHTVCSLEVEREIAPLCLRKEVYPVGSGRLCGSHCPNVTSSPKTLASCFLASPLAFLSSKRQNGSGNIACSCGSSHNVTSSSSCSFATPTPSCPATSSVCHPLFPANTSSVPTVHQTSASVSSFCSVPSLRIDEHKLKQDDAEQNSCFRLELDVQERCEEKSLSDSEIKMESMKQRERGKVSQIKIRKSLPKPPTNLTPMGLPKPVRLKKKEFSLEEIYTNKNFHEPPDGRLETIFEVPISGRDGSVSVASQRRIKRFVEFPEAGMPRKPRRPVIRSGVSRKAVESSNLARTRRGGYDRTKEGGILTLQDIEAILCSKLEQLDTWIALDEDGLSV
ncbi:uncharacterized protein LOC135247988 [Anguilla rostrata]|uniref:uncharacterized protein LOC135247988 n=1 Tax=Anguilla rostrata TaxID=7938 RepID=UPI0030D2D623